MYPSEFNRYTLEEYRISFLPHALIEPSEREKAYNNPFPQPTSTNPPSGSARSTPSFSDIVRGYISSHRQINHAQIATSSKTCFEGSVFSAQLEARNLGKVIRGEGSSILIIVALFPLSPKEDSSRYTSREAKRIREKNARIFRFQSLVNILNSLFRYQ